MRLIDRHNEARGGVVSGNDALSEINIQNDNILPETAQTAVVIIDSDGTIKQTNSHFGDLFYSDYPDLKNLGDVIMRAGIMQGMWLKEIMNSDDKMYPKVQTPLKGKDYYFTVMLTPFSSFSEELYIVTMTDITKVVELHIKEVEISKELAYKQGIFDITSEYIHNIGNIVTGARHNVERVEENLRPLEQFAPFFDRLKIEVDVIRTTMGDLAKQCEKNFKKLDNGLMVIQSSIEDIAKNTVNEDVAKLRTAVENISKTISYQQEMYKQNNTQQAIILEDIDVNNLIQEVIIAIESKAKSFNIQITNKVEENLKITHNKINLFNGLLNLVTNAVHSVIEASEMGIIGDKQISIIAYSETENSGFFEVDAFDDDEGFTVESKIIFIICDNGIGIAPETLEKLFVRGFTTKKEGHGLGLHSFANFLKEHDGDIIVSSDGLGRGACFTVTIKQKERRSY